MAQIDARQLKGRAMSAVVLDGPDSDDASPYLQTIEKCRGKRDGRRPLALLVVAPNLHYGSAHIALNLASAAVLLGESVLLVDADLRARRLSRTLCPKARRGIGEVVRGEVELDQVIWHDPETFDLLPAARRSGLGGNGAGQGPGLRGLLAEARRDYELIVIDGGTLGSSTAGARVAAVCDEVVLVVCARRGETNVDIRLPDQIKLQGNKVIGAVALMEARAE